MGSNKMTEAPTTTAAAGRKSRLWIAAVILMIIALLAWTTLRDPESGPGPEERHFVCVWRMMRPVSAARRIAVVGVGAIGGSVAADLADLGRHQVALCVRTRFACLEVAHPAGTSRADARIVSDPEASSTRRVARMVKRRSQLIGRVPGAIASGPGGKG